MAIDYGIEVLVDSSLNADRKAKLLRDILLALSAHTLSPVYAASYLAGSGATIQNTITVGGATTDFGIKLIFDSAVVGADVVPEIVEKVIRRLKAETLTIAHAAAYAAGTGRVYQVTITVT